MDNLIWYGNSAFGITGEKQIYIDPFMLPDGLSKADIIFITHAHPDHLSPGDIQKILKEDTVIIAPPDCLEVIEISEDRKIAVIPLDGYTSGGISFSTIPAYNTDPAKQQFHPKENNWVGYVISVNGQMIFHAGDTDYVPEMNALASQDIDIAILPMGGTYTMEAHKAARAANAIKAKVTIPMHYKGQIERSGGNPADAEEIFKKEVMKSRVEIL